MYFLKSITFFVYPYLRVVQIKFLLLLLLLLLLLKLCMVISRCFFVGSVATKCTEMRAARLFPLFKLMTLLLLPFCRVIVAGAVVVA